MGSTSDIAQALDDAQYSAGDGPCLTAARDRLVVRIDEADTEQRWPQLLPSSRRVSADDAFDLLVARSQTENRKLREVASDVLREAVGDDNA